MTTTQYRTSTNLTKKQSGLPYIYRALLILGAGSMVTIGLIWLINEKSIIGLEEQLLIFFSHSADLANPLGSTAIEEAIRDLTFLGGTLVTTLLAVYVVVLLFLHEKRRHAMFLAIAVLLAVCISMPSVAYSAELERDALFHIERNKNANIVQYDAQVTENGKLYSKEPVVGYWIRQADKGQIQELSWIQNKFAYGFSTKLHKQENTATLDMAANLGREILVRQDADDYRAVARIDGADSYIEKIFIHATGKGASTKVNYIELYGKAVINGKDQYERFSP